MQNMGLLYPQKGMVPMKRNIAMYQLALRSFTADGTLNSAAELLPFIKETGFDMLYLCPVFAADDDMDKSCWSSRQIQSGTENPKNPYKMKDYYNVDEEYGTNQDLKAFIDKAHSLGIQVLLDLVYLHCGRNAVFIVEHPDWVEQDENGDPRVGELWPFARINYSNDGVREYLWQNMEMFIRDYKVDGFRCDVGDSVPLDFWREGKRRILEINPDALMLNEGGKPEYVEDVFELNYFNGVGRRLFDMMEYESVSSFLRERLNEVITNGVGGKTINFIENHDTASDTVENRIESAFGSEVVDAMVVLIYTWLGVPLMFNGNEIADKKEQCMFSNRFYARRVGIDWSNLLREDGKRRLELTKALNALRREYPAVYSDELELLEGTSAKSAAYIKSGKLLVALNFGSEEAVYNVPSSGKVILSHNAEVNSSSVKLCGAGFALVEI